MLWHRIVIFISLGIPAVLRTLTQCHYGGTLKVKIYLYGVFHCHVLHFVLQWNF